MKAMRVRGENGSFALSRPDYVDARVLAANTAEQHTIPTFTDHLGNTKTARHVIFNATADFYAAYGTNPTAAVPAADVTDGTASELNPTIRFLDGADTKISLISAGTCIVTMAFFYE